MKVLAVDDSRLNLAVAEKHLKEIAEVSTIFLTDKPEETKKLIDDNNIDILILDLVMPKITGFDILKMLRSDRRYDDMPIIVFTSLDNNESLKKSFELGASDYIHKPINAVEFKARIASAIRLKSNSNKLKQLLLLSNMQNEELKQMNAKLTDAKFHLVQSEKMAAIGQLAAGIAHEINNPIGFVNSNCEILERYIKRITDYLDYQNEILTEANNIPVKLDEIKEKLAEKYKKNKIDIVMQELEGIFSESKSGISRVTDIVQSLRVFSRSVKDDEKDSYKLLDLINQVMLISRNEVKYVSEIQLNISEDIIIFCNKVQLGQVFINLIVNAAQAIKSQKRNEMGLITITAEATDHHTLIYIEDDGPGIPEENLIKIFEPFFTTKDIGQGTGLGLSISYDIIVNKHNGQINVKSDVEKGTVFTITLPKYTD